MAPSFDPPTENANPVILAVDKSRLKKKQALVWSEGLAAISAENPTDITNGNIIVRTAEDRAILQALTDAAAASHGQGVSLLRNIGLVIPTNRKDLPFAQTPSPPPLFTYSATTTSTTGSASSFTGSSSRNAKQPTAAKTAADISSPLPRRDKVDADEIFEIIRNIQDPEHPVTLEQLGVVSRDQIEVFDILDVPPEERPDGACSTLNVRFTPTIPHCSMATQIGLSIIVKLNRSLPSRFKTTVRIEPGTHASEDATNKQLADKERVCAALENKHLLGIVNKCIINGMTGNMS
jgi:metal-sulfur cluster biosynthetic enzyme